MKGIHLLVGLILGISATAQKTILVHNVFFKKDQVGLDDTQKQILESIAQKMQPGQKVMLFPLTIEGNTKEMSFSDYSDVQADELLNFATGIGCEGQVQKNFPSGYKGRSMAVTLSKTLKDESIPTVSLQGHFPEKPSQFFKIHPDQDTVLYGKEGTVLFVPAGSFLSSADIVQVELKEFYSFADLMKNNLHTSSDGRMLQTGGSIYLNAKENNHNGSTAFINPDKGVGVDFALGKNDPEMRIFIKDPEQEELNWIPTRYSKTTVTEKVVWTDGEGNVISEEEALARIERIKNYEKERKAFDQRQADLAKQAKELSHFDEKLKVYDLGYINCDKFPDEQMKSLQAKADERFTATYYLVYKDVRGLMKGSQYGKDVDFGMIPKNRSATLIAVAFDGAQAYFSRIELSPNSACPPIKLQASTEKYVDQQLALLK